MTTSTRERIVAAQRAWAVREGFELDEHHRVRTVGDNLFQDLDGRTVSEFEAGAGGELGSVGAPGKLASVYSSSALAVNMFDFWRSRSAEPLFGALGLSRRGSVVRFESKHRTGLRGTAPHLDVELVDGDGVPVGVESKFTEPYGTVHNGFRPAYFEQDGLWEGLPRLRTLARGIAADAVTYSHVHAAQLIKHTLGLARSFGPRAFILMYLWYDVDDSEGRRHREEVHSFAEAVDGEVRFTACTYQEVLGRFEADTESRPWHRYMTDRYIDSMRAPAR